MGTNEWLLVIVMIIGLVGTILPLVPGMGLIFVGVLVYGFVNGWAAYSWWYVGLVGLLGTICMGLDYLGSAVGAKKFGASKAGFLGAIIGGIIGMLVFSIIGLILGSLLGVILAELYQKKTIEQSLTAATGVLIGSVVGAALQFVLAGVVVVMTIVKIWS